MTTDIISTECCNVQIHSDQRYCPKCGYECRIHTRKTEGDKCVHSDCDGLFEYIRQGQCSCHISPPCSSCVDAPLVCNKCGEYSEDEINHLAGCLNDMVDDLCKK